ncbi:MAG: DEAD/DEAH box helicase family protein [Armatimonadetes bacterium]|nr:DEAD/DEAH box helicase family protein [Armatimonadota bacterium]
MGEDSNSTISSIIDNRGENTLLAGIKRMGGGGQEISIATAFFSLDALLLLADDLAEYERIRILFGDDANPKQRRQLLTMLRMKSDTDLLKQRENAPLLTALQKMEALFLEGRVEARCYTPKKFHAKAYLVARPRIHPSRMAVIGSGNFTRPGLEQNIELNVELTPEQTSQLAEWYEEMWAEAQEDVVTDDVLAEIRRQITLYEPYILYLKALYTWGFDRHGLPTRDTSRLLNMLDKHQEEGYGQALKIIERQNGVMICDGVGLGKSFIALALMEYYLREGKKVLLIAPKNIIENSWKFYLNDYLSRYREPYGSIHYEAMTAFGYDPEDPDVKDEDLWLLDGLASQVDVIVIDESHNFRTTSSNRYKNLWRIVEPFDGNRKKLILLTATPLNTAYQDISAQLALVTHEKGSIGAYTVQQIRKYANALDKDKPEYDPSGQLALHLAETPSEGLNRVLEAALIQRSRKTCKALSRAAGRPLRFPKRKDPECIECTIGAESEEYRKLINGAERIFRPGVVYLRELQKATQEAKEQPESVEGKKTPHAPKKGISLAAFLTEQYRFKPEPGQKQYTDEVHLAGLVYANTLKQLESSPVAFQGIIQSLAVGLLARLKFVFGDAVSDVIEEHSPWARTPLLPVNEAEPEECDSTDIIEDGDTVDASGDEADEWLQIAVRSRGLQKKLRDFTEEKYDRERWKNGIIADLGYLRQIHDAILKARQQPDPKLEQVCPVILEELAKKSRVLVFTQSRRTAEYLEQELKARLTGFNVARIDSRVEDTRAAILYAFCPFYNPEKHAPSVPKRIDVLISTDVLSEGVNLQEAGVILNYDIHWNPVRLIQRIGRVDRRLDEKDTRPNPQFSIYNIFPAPEINKIINLVGSVEKRTLKISKALGLDESFFKSTDPAGTLKEFNKLYEGEMKAVDVASTKYVEVFDKPDPEIAALLEKLPPGAFGVWGNAPKDGLFALFTMEATEKASEADRAKFAQVIGRPVLVLEQTGLPVCHDAGEILDILSKTVEGESSGVPTNEGELSKRLTKLKNSVRGLFSDIGLPGTILPRLECWMELRKGNG